MEFKRYGIFVHTAKPYETAIEATKAALKDEGFGVLTEIDVKETMRQKLGVEFRPYVIFGACNPQLAHRALEAELDIGLLLPCNVVVYEDGDGCTIAALDPATLTGLTANEALRGIAVEARARLMRALQAAA